MVAKKRFDTVLSGLIPGLLLPLVTMVIIWAVRFEGGIRDFLSNFHQIHMLSKVLSLATIPNLLLFFLFIWTNRIFPARGVIFATLVVGIIIVILKILDGSLLG